MIQNDYYFLHSENPKVNSIACSVYIYLLFFIKKKKTMYIYVNNYNISNFTLRMVKCLKRGKLSLDRYLNFVLVKVVFIK